MALRARELYRSPNGDRWSLVSETDSDHVFVRHHPNPSSGGEAGDLDVGDFLIRGGNGPEKQELMRLIGSLATEPMR